MLFWVHSFGADDQDERIVNDHFVNGSFMNFHQLFALLIIDVHKVEKMGLWMFQWNV